MPSSKSFCRVDNSSERRGDNNPLNFRSIFLNSLKDTDSTLDSGIKEVFLGVFNVEVERRGGVEDGFKWRRGFDRFVEGAGSGDVGNDGVVD
jgi:hypothetical protein